MVLADDLGHLAVEADQSGGVGTGVGVLADDLHLGFGEAPGLGQDLGRHDDLADVVQQGRHPERLQGRLLQVELAGDGAGELGHAALVAGGVGVAQLCCGTEGGDRPLQGQPQLDGAVGEVLLRLADLGHVEADADDAGGLARDIGVDRLVGHQVARRAVGGPRLEQQLDALVRISEQLFVGGVVALGHLYGVDVVDGLADDLFLGEPERLGVGLVAGDVVEGDVGVVNRGRDRLQELLQEVGTVNVDPKQQREPIESGSTSVL